jgi:Ca-activated chloride channel family protein
MSEHELERLKSLPVPPPRAEAKARAIAAARAAFAQESADQGVSVNSNEVPKASDGNARQTHAFPNTRRNRMRVSNYAMAASIAALCVAAPAAFYVIKSMPDRGATQPKKDAVVAQVPQEPARSQGEPRTAANSRAATQADPVEPAKIGETIFAVAPPPSTDTAAKAKEDAGAARLEAERQRLAARIVAEQKAREEAARGQVADGRVDALKREAQSRLGGTVAQAVPAAPPVAAAPLTVAPQFKEGAMFLRRPGTAASPGSAGWKDSQVAVLAPPSLREPYVAPQVEQGRDRFEGKEINPVKQVAAEPVSTFSIDVDTASYSFVRRSLNAGRLPPKDAVRVEEMINYFPYDYARPESADAPFRASVQVFPSPWNARNQLVHIGLKGYDLKSKDRPRANLVLLVDISGSMGPADRLPLLKNAFRMLVDNLAADDTVAIVTYANGSDIRLQPTKAAEKSKIIAAIDSLHAGGSTHGAAGITDAYAVAEANFDKAAVNRVILATDGDWNVGITNRNELKGFVERKRQTGIFLSILGVGMGNHNDALMQALAQNGNGAAAYIDTLNEARKVLVDEASSTLFPIAKDVKIQLEFNPARVSEYRLIGYESRMLRREDFNNDKVDAGDVGSGHSVTAIYEITPVGAPVLADPLRYQSAPAAAKAATPPADGKQSEIGFLKLRYKLPKEEASRLTEFVIGPDQTTKTVAEATTEARFSVAVAAFGQLLRGTPHVQGYSWDDVIALANGARGEDAFGYRAEFVNLVRLAKSASVSVGQPR